MNGPLEGCLLCRTTARETERGMQQCSLSRSPRGHSDDAMHQTNPKGDHTARSDHSLRGMQNKKDKHTSSLLQIVILHVCRTIQGCTVTCDDCGSLKETHGRSGTRPHHCLKDPLEAFRDRQLIVIPSSSSSKLSLIPGRK